MIRRAIVALALLGTAPTLAQPATTPAAQSEDQRLAALFAASDEGLLRRQPLQALFRGDLRYADRLGDYYSDAFYAAEKAASEADLNALHAIDRARLNPTDQIAYDVFEWQTVHDLAAFRPENLRIQKVLPVSHFGGLTIYYPTVASGRGAAPFKTVADYDNNLKRNADYVRMLGEIVDRFRQGLAAGIVHPRLVVQNMIEQFDNQLAQGVEGSTFYGPVKDFPATVSAADQARLRTAYAAFIRDQLIPATTRLRDFLKADYLPRARDTAGLSALPGGNRYYAYRLEQSATLPMGAREIHDLGLSEVARITREMEAQKAATGFTGTLPDFFTFLRTDPRFAPKSRDDLRLGFEAIGARVARRIPEQFSTIPKSPLEIRAVPTFREKTAAGGSYEEGTPDGTRPGVFYYNAYDLPTRYTWGMETLYLHEAIPGHHFQISLAQENTALPAFMRFGGNVAFVEGWALYAETLWRELGMETDPYQRLGGLNDEMLRAMRLVVDTGIHAYGWSRDKAIAYMLDNSAMSRTDATAEVERYIATPGQAVGYKIGALTIQRLKAKAQAALGLRFDPRAFHAQVLMTGSLPLAVLERKIDAWIAANK